MKFRSIFALVVFVVLAAASRSFGQSISSVDPTIGSVGDLVHIYGSGFSGTLVVRFNGVQATNGTGIVGPTNIQTQVPTNATSGYVTVQINGGTPVNSPQPFVVVVTNQPYATNFSPVIGGNGTAVTIKGIHFASVTNVSFNGKLGSGMIPGLNQIQITAPTGVATGPLILLSTNGRHFSTISNTVTSATNFFVQPIITSFSPTSGRAGTNVIISGTNFIGASNVLFGGITVGSSGFTILSNNAIQIPVPANAISGPMQVMAPAGPSSLTTSFHMLPTVSGFSPVFGGTGTIVVISGTNLNEVAAGNQPTVTFNGISATVSGFSFGSVTAAVPASATSGPISVGTTNGSMTSAQLFYVPASITSFTPTNGSSGTIVKITGVNFTNASAVSFNGIPSTDFSVTNNTIIGAKAPNGVTSGTISVTTPAGTAISSTLFYVAPTITDFTPTHGLPGTNVVITGTSFTNASAVLFNGVAASSFHVTNNTTLSAVVSNNTTTGKITVIAPGGTNSSTNDFVIDTTDLGVSVKDSPDPVFIGSNLVYTITITNLSAFVANNVKLTNSLPSSVTLKSATTSQGTLTTNVALIYGALGTINNGGSATVTLTVTPTAIGSITNSALVTSDSLDSNLSNNTNSAVTTVWPLPFLSITNLMTNDLVKISWPAPLSNFTLQFRTDLSTSVQWTNDSGAKVLSGTNVSVTETSIGNVRFFRLTN